MAIAGPGNDGGDGAVLEVERLAPLGIVPGDRRRRRSIVETELAFTPRSAVPEAQAVMRGRRRADPGGGERGSDAGKPLPSSPPSRRSCRSRPRLCLGREFRQQPGGEMLPVRGIALRVACRDRVEGTHQGRPNRSSVARPGAIGARGIAQPAGSREERSSQGQVRMVTIRTSLSLSSSWWTSQMNSPFLDEKGWRAEVTKMVNSFGAPIGAAD